MLAMISSRSERIKIQVYLRISKENKNKRLVFLDIQSNTPSSEAVLQRTNNNT
jgi:hypothetical protein